MQPSSWHKLSADQVFDQLQSSANGLTTTVAQQRLQQQGANTIPEAKRRSLLRMLLAQFADVMIVVLLIAALISGVIGEPQDTIAIVVIVVLNALVGLTQEYRAEKAVAALREMAAPETQVLRDGRVITMATAHLVPGDVVILETGNIVPAELRLFEVEELQCDESALTGESTAVEKNALPLKEGVVAAADQHNLAFKSCLVTRGRGKGVVVATGLDTRIGQIAQLLQRAASVKTPLQLRLARFSRHLAIAVLAICAVVFSAGLLQGQPVLLMFLTAVSLAVAAIPEALPAVVSISLALGARKLIQHKALVRNLPAVETLGSVTYICADKTGTLTQNRMTAELFFVDGQRHLAWPDVAAEYSWTELGRALALNNDIDMLDGKAAGEATELALYQAAAEAGFDKAMILEACPRLAVLPFDSQRKQMTTLHQTPEGVVAYIKGAPEKVLAQCNSGLADEGQSASGSFDLEQVSLQAQQLADEGYRVLALAKRSLRQLPAQIEAESIEKELVFLGLIGLIDPLRPEVPKSVAQCLGAGITPVMITGDHPGTAKAIAARLGIATDDEATLSGEQLAQLGDDDFANRVERVRVYARVTPEQKLRIVKALQFQGEFVAMTGDGVNDAPALKRANIGVAMGQKGTDVAREAADMVLLDDNFATIVDAVGAGRRVFDNIRKFIKYTMSSNAGEIWTLFLAPFLGLPIPLLPIHILWINLVTDGLPGLALTAEPAEPGIMQRKPRPPEESIFAHGMWQHIIWVGLFIAGLSIGAMAWAISRNASYWQTMVFTVLTLSQLFHSLAVRSEVTSLARIGLFSNIPMLVAISVTLLMQLAVIYSPLLNEIFHTQPLPLYDLGVCLALSSLVLIAVEIEKWLVRRGWIYTDSALPVVVSAGK